MSGKYADEKADLNPRSWLSKYRQTSIRYLIKMALFCHGLGYILALIGAVIAQQIIPEYKAPLIPLTLAEALSAGPFEETIFFGIPFYATGNHYVVLGMGIVWASAIPNSESSNERRDRRTYRARLEVYRSVTKRQSDLRGSPTPWGRASAGNRTPAKGSTVPYTAAILRRPLLRITTIFRCSLV